MIKEHDLQTQGHNRFLRDQYNKKNAYHALTF